jgi:hypothetical protein
MTALSDHQHLPHLPLVIEIQGLKATLLKAGRLLVEAALVPTVLLAVLLHTAGLPWALGSALGWMMLTVGLRWSRDRHLPGTLLLCAGMLSGRAAVALATSSAFIYLVQPVLGSILMGLLFMGSAFVGRPVTIRLARDFVHVPLHVLERHSVRRMFTQVALLWGASRIADAGMNFGFLRTSVDAGMMSRGLLSPVLTIATVTICAAWGIRALRREGVSVRLVPAPARVAA